MSCRRHAVPTLIPTVRRPNGRLALRCLALATIAAAFLPLASVGHAQQKVLNLYSARHYQTDEALYNNFTRATGIRINRIEAGDDQLLERLKSEGVNSPGDVLLIVDAARLYNAQLQGLFQPVRSKLLEERIPANLRDPNGEWFGFSTRARVLIYNPAMIKASEIATYEALADPGLKGKVCARSGSNPYNLTLVSSIIGRLGEAKAEAWAKGVVANFARPPKGGDTDQIKAVAAGECGVAIANTYYYARLYRSTKPEDKDVVAKTAVVFPGQSGAGTHVNISGGGVLKNSPNRENAIRFLEYLASDEAQRYFADGNNEWPAVRNVRVQNPALDAMGGGDFRIDPISVAVLGRNTSAAQKLVDRAGWR